MKPNELRIGNYVLANGLYAGKVLQVESIGEKGTLSEDKRVIQFKNKHTGEFLSDIKPIPLTEEWLLKFGLELLYGSCFKIVEDDFEDDDDFFCVQAKADGVWCFYITSPIKKVDISLSFIKHVHELQNLYFALTGEELQIKNQNPNKPSVITT